MLTRVLHLTREQLRLIKEILIEQGARMQELQAAETEAELRASLAMPSSESRPEQQDRLEEMARIRTETNTRILALLNDTQQKLFHQWWEKQQEKIALKNRPVSQAFPVSTQEEPPPTSQAVNEPAPISLSNGSSSH